MRETREGNEAGESERMARDRKLDAIVSCLHLIATCLRFETTDHGYGAEGRGRRRLHVPGKKGFLFGRVVVCSGSSTCSGRHRAPSSTYTSLGKKKEN